MIRPASTPAFLERARPRLTVLYGSAGEPCAERLAMLVGRYGLGPARGPAPMPWSPETAVLIAYPDMLRAPGVAPLAVLKRFADRRLAAAFSHIHILPFFPSSSDDGFAVVHYRQVDPAFGGWPDIQALGERFGLMFDLVLNHVSRQSGWFQDFIAGVAPGRDYFITADPAADWSAVVRPRTSPLLTAVRTRAGERYVWTTFSADQVDLNFACPDVLFEMLDILLFYVAMGARIIRLDAIAYIWKEIGTGCVHRPQVHEIVRLFRDLLDLVAPGTLLLTETNVPHADNVAYFGAGDEARMVYQFALPPLLLHALLHGDARRLTRWAAALAPPPPGCAFFNFTASHDGIGVLPARDWLDDDELDALCAHTLRCGGQVSMRRGPDGKDTPYELNTTWFDAMRMSDREDTAMQTARFLCSQAVQLALAGVPAIYFQSLVACPNDQPAFLAGGRPRALNRRKWSESELNDALANRHTTAARIFSALTRLLEIRRRQPAFHPDGPQEILDLDPRLFALRRTAPDGSQTILAIHNLSTETVTLPPAARADRAAWRDLVSAPAATDAAAPAAIPPCGFLWLVAD